MGWIFPILVSAAILLALYRSPSVNRRAFELCVVAVLVGLAGYAWQASPDLPETRPAKLMSANAAVSTDGIGG